MSKSLPTYDETTLTGSNFSQGQTTENVIQNEPSMHVFVVPSNTVQSQPQPQPQRQSMRNAENINIHGVSSINLELIHIKDYQCWSIFNILCCCFCFGFIACYYSNKTHNMKLRGDFLRAFDASRTARIINIIATVLGIIIISFLLLQNLNA